MVGGTLRDIRAEIRSLSCPSGDFEVVCSRTGTAPAAVAGLQFPDRHAAGEAAELATEYRTVIRRYDPAAPYHDPLVQESSKQSVDPLATDAEDRQTRFHSFCNDVAGAVFESLSETDNRETESAAMETYLTLAEVVDDEEDFCLTMVWSLMSEMDVRLSASEQTTVVERAAAKFASVQTPNPVESMLRTLESVGFVDAHSVRPLPDDELGRRDGRNRHANTRRWELTFGDYALAERTGRIPTLPLAVDLLRRTTSQGVQFVDGEALSDSRWRLRVYFSPTGPSDGLVSVDVAENRWLNDTGASPRQE